MRSIFEIAARSGIKCRNPTSLPIQVQRRPSEPMPMGPTPGGSTPGDQLATAKAQQQHREALRLALGSILTPKRPPILPSSRSSSGAATPAHPSPWLSGPVSGAQTPAGTPPTASPYIAAGHGPNSSEHLHPHYPYHGHPHPHPLPPSKLGRSSSSSSNSPVESAHNSAPNSGHPSPHTGIGTAVGAQMVLSTVPDVEPLPPAMLAGPHSDSNVNEGGISGNGEVKPVRPSIAPLHPNKEGSTVASLAGAGTVEGSDAMHVQTEAGSQSGRGTPRAKFLQTLQSKSAWDALIHGSFS
ncbi:hypothetical protein CVT25_004948 [Psilocybe cyanescens]|uniref:Uncharacterized protein n=1 Tax=Psilocybe cyanescens TaxID=93625 RepID=A0A409XUB8_PSICY|nr:hypothetical protein CVT25_004948 [Psilocybe cyanescens]